MLPPSHPFDQCGFHMKTHLVWFRNDLRLHDNPALYAACNDENTKIFSVFIATPEQWKKHGMSPEQATFTHNNLIELKNSLAELNIPLLYKSCPNFSDSVEIIFKLCRLHKVDHLFFNKQYEVNEKKKR